MINSVYTAPEKHTCPICGYEWRQGMSGAHHCADYLKVALNEVTKERDEFRDAIKAMGGMLKEREWANLLSGNELIAELDHQITILIGGKGKHIHQRNELIEVLKSLNYKASDDCYNAQIVKAALLKIKGGDDVWY